MSLVGVSAPPGGLHVLGVQGCTHGCASECTPTATTQPSRVSAAAATTSAIEHNILSTAVVRQKPEPRQS